MIIDTEKLRDEIAADVRATKGQAGRIKQSVRKIATAQAIGEELGEKVSLVLQAEVLAARYDPAHHVCEVEDKKRVLGEAVALLEEWSQRAAMNDRFPDLIEKTTEYVGRHYRGISEAWIIDTEKLREGYERGEGETTEGERGSASKESITDSFKG